jgi:hypothetical protein
MARPRSEPAAEPEPTPPEQADEVVEIDPYTTVVQALSRVMGDVQSISKNSRTSQGNQSFNFRGIDAVMNAVGPALRRHGVVVVPVETHYEFEHYETSRGTKMKGVTLTVTFRFYGPQGDYIDAMATGESSDAGDKAMPKAHSVAFRTLLLQALCIPTDEPDPDAEVHERASQPFQGSTGSEPRARQQGEGRPGYNYPKDWKELGERMSALLGADEAVVWITQAVEVVTGQRNTISNLPEDDRRLVWGTLTKVLRSLDEELKVDPGSFPPPTRDEIAGAFAKHLDGAVLAGPQWALSGEEADSGRESKEAVLGAATADEGGGPSATPEEEPAATEPREPTDEEIAEAQQALLDEEAAEAAARDPEQFRDRN